jgi:superfamily II helicase
LLVALTHHSRCYAQTEAVAGFLIGAGFDAAAYHAGKHHDERTRMQNLFFQNKLRIIVATGNLATNSSSLFALSPCADPHSVTDM